jgi:hypothetical protein
VNHKTYRQKRCSYELIIGKSCKKAEVGRKYDEIKKENEASISTNRAGECNEANEADNDRKSKSV